MGGLCTTTNGHGVDAELCVLAGKGNLPKRILDVLKIAVLTTAASPSKPEVWKDVYGRRASSFQKDIQFSYGPDVYGGAPGIVRADNESHSRQRKLVSHAFSDKALKDQESLLKSHVGILTEKLEKIAASGSVTDMVKWYNFTTFDIMSDLTFGESLNQLTGSKYSDWVEAVFGFVKAVSYARIGREWGLTGLLHALLPADIKAKRQGHINFAAENVDKRMAQKTERPDLWTYVTKNSHIEGQELNLDELHSNGATFMLAGTETTATLLSGLTYILIQNPEKLARLTKEIRSSCRTFDDLTMTNLSQLQYLQACLEEGLRLYPPVPSGLPRVTPKEARSPKNFKNPEKFAPERYLPEGAKEYAGDRKEAHQPFSFGPRNCLGKNLAYHEMRLILASMLLHFNWELSAITGDWLDQECYFIWAKKPLLVKLTPAHC
ncbi:cytochrome P450 [Phaeosphaeria sp. MPI-PUGE-AT-0046c]|nr:cytochrome P450 [Phaeosphaeria sp. MPI-PUGE-AT-0046c]